MPEENFSDSEYLAYDPFASGFDASNVDDPAKDLMRTI